MQWIEITIHTNTNGADAMADVFFSLGIAGVSIEDAADIALYQRESNDWDYIDESIFANRGGDVRVKAYIQDEPVPPALTPAPARWKRNPCKRKIGRKTGSSIISPLP